MTIDTTRLSLNTLAVLRQRRDLDEDDGSKDHLFAKMSPEGIVAEYAAWYLGDSRWGREIVQVYKDAVEASK